ncbi:MAG: hypothetical protein ACK4RV_00755 [Caulobacter sp.]
MRRFILPVAAFAALAILPAQAAAQELAARFEEVCLKTNADPAKVVAKAEAMGFEPFQAPPVANLQEVRGFNKVIDGKGWAIVSASGVAPAGGGAPAQRMKACNVSSDDPQEISVRAVGQMLGNPELGQSGKEMYFFTEENGRRTVLNPADNAAVMAALNGRGFWIALIMKEGDTRSISIIHSVAAK